MATCPRCAAINFEDGCLYALGSVGFMIKSALAGCPGCAFILAAARRDEDQESENEGSSGSSENISEDSDDEDNTKRSDDADQDLSNEREANLSEDTSQDNRNGQDESSKNGSEEDFKVQHRPELQVLLQRYSSDSNRVDVNFISSPGPAMDVVHHLQLRLCTANGVELAPWAEFEGKNTGHLGRLVAEDSGNEQCLDLARSWLARCTRYHGLQCALPHEVELPTRLIHVPAAEDSLPRLCHTEGRRGQYATLSYCWGSGGACKTTPSNFEERQRGIPLDEMPKTVRDAIHLVRRMGIGYIWIDALCIIQEEASLEDWTHESSLMAQVYGRSLFTICVDWAESTDVGIFGTRNVLNSHRFGASGDYQLQTLTRGWGSSMIGQPLYGRGWAFQERILSTRNIHFLANQIAWECNTTIYIESVRGRQSDRGSHFGKSIVTKHTRRDLSDRMTPAAPANDVEIWNRILAWNAIVVQEMGVREFTHESDRLPAVSGLATAFEVPELGDYFAGVWSWNPFLSMAWWGAHEQSARDKRVPSWTGIGAHWLIRWACDHNKEDDDTDWRKWDVKFGPRLVDKTMIYPDTEKPNRKGRVLEGSHLVMAGFCRKVFVSETPGVEFQNGPCPLEEERDSEDAHRPGVLVAMDVREDNRGSVGSFFADFSDHPEPQQQDRIDNARSYICVQLQHRREKLRYPRIFALLLEGVEDQDEDSYQRVGIVCFDEVTGEEQWIKRTLKLF